VSFTGEQYVDISGEIWGEGRVDDYLGIDYFKFSVESGAIIRWTNHFSTFPSKSYISFTSLCDTVSDNRMSGMN